MIGSHIQAPTDLTLSNAHLRIGDFNSAQSEIALDYQQQSVSNLGRDFDMETVYTVADPQYNYEIIDVQFYLHNGKKKKRVKKKKRRVGGGGTEYMSSRASVINSPAKKSPEWPNH